MGAIRYISPIRHVLTYLHAVMGKMCGKFFQDSSKTESQVCIGTEQTVRETRLYRFYKVLLPITNIFLCHKVIIPFYPEGSEYQNQNKKITNMHKMENQECRAKGGEAETGSRLKVKAMPKYKTQFVCVIRLGVRGTQEATNLAAPLCTYNVNYVNFLLEK